MIEESFAVGIRGEKQGDHVDALIRLPVGEHVRKMLSDDKDVPGSELPEAIPDIKGPFPLEYAADLDFLVLVQLGKEIFGPIFL